MASYSVAKLLKTGQTTQYSSELDDGYYQKGVSKSYTILTTGRYSGTTDITIGGKTDVHSNNCVLDDNTGLMWSRYVSGSVGTGSDGKLPWTGGDDIFAYCAAANTASLGGYTDWRVANINEMFSLPNYENATRVPYSTAFPSFPITPVWSSTTMKQDTTNAFWMRTDTDIWLGGTDTKTTTSYFVLLVRGG